MVLHRKMSGNKEDSMMKKIISISGWIALATALIMMGPSACSIDDELQPTDNTPVTYTLTVSATKGDDIATRALTLSADGKTLNATWAKGEMVQVYSVTGVGLEEMASAYPVGALTAQSSGVTTTLKGEFISTFKPTAGAKLRLKFNEKPDYSEQDGTLDYIATHCDYAVADIIVNTVDTETGDVTSTATAAFQNQQSIVKFSLKHPDGTTPLSAMSLTLKVGGTTYNVTPTIATSDIYVAIEQASNKAVSLSVISADADNYSYSKSGVSFGKSQYYAIGVTMTADHPYATIDLSTLTGNYTVPDGYTILTGRLSGNYKISISDGATVKLSGVTINGVNWADCPWAGITCLGDATIVLAEGTTNSVKGFHHFYPGILPAVGKTLTIRGTGSLTVSSNGYASGIGGGNGISCGNIRIENGTINTTGSGDSPGIGSAVGSIELGNSRCGTITIVGGNVTATGGGQFAAGIGSGYCNSGTSSCDAIRIEGGIVTATAGKSATAIGKGFAESDGTSSCASITFTTGITSLTLKNPNASGRNPYANQFLGAEQVMAHTVDITSSLSGANGIVGLFNEKNPGFYALFPQSTFNENTGTWIIAP